MSPHSTRSPRFSRRTLIASSLAGAALLLVTIEPAAGATMSDPPQT